MHKNHPKRRARRSLAVACAGCLLPAAAPTLAQDMNESRGTIKVEVTGSNIPRSEVESALPVQVITREDIARSGSTTVPELISKVSANILGYNDQLSLGFLGQPGLASANLRGIGDGSTLVLLNGRRVANYAFNGGTVDLNSIPLSAVDRVEILKDGASAIYGSDAIAGVVNFILRKDFQGVEVSGYGAWTEHGAGNQWQATLTAGYGDLSKDRFNVFATVDYQKDEALRAIDRPFSRTAYIPAEGFNRLNLNAFPANIVVPPPEPSGRTQILNPTYAVGCAPPVSIAVAGPTQACFFDSASVSDTIPPVERTSIVARGTYAINADNQIFSEADYAANRFSFSISPTPAFFESAFAYPAGGPYYPSAFAAANGLSGDLTLRYRTVPLGPRINETDTDAWRAVIGAEGVVAGWNYGAALVYSKTEQTDSFPSGWVSFQRLSAAMATGLINPFGPSAPEGESLLASTQIVGEIHRAQASTTLVDAKVSKDIYPLAGGPFAIAVGTEARREKLDNEWAPVFTSGDLVGLPGDVQSVSGSRSVEAAYVEASVPFAKGFEAQLAARFDHYSDFGNTVNPKIAFRWQPIRSLLLRTSWGTGFRAPPLPDLYEPVKHEFVAEFDDPIRCPVTGFERDCATFFRAAFGGNLNLEPETSEQVNAGVVWEPVAGLSFAVDYWKIRKSGVIGSLDTTTLFENYARYAPTHIVRGPPDPAHPNLPGPIETVILLNENLGNLRTSGIDVDVNWRLPVTPIGRFTFALNGTYFIDWEQQLDGINYTSNLAMRWKHRLALGWDYGPWGVTLGQTYQSGYLDANIAANGDPLTVPPRSVGAYDVWDVQGRYTGFRNTTLILGIKNLMDRAPPFTNQPYSFQAGYDPTYADPRGRTFYARVTYAFK